MSLQLTDDCIRHIVGYNDIIFRIKPLQFRQHAERIGKVTLLLLRHWQQQNNTDTSSATNCLLSSFDDLLAAQENEPLSQQTQQAINDCLYALNGASLRYQKFWWEIRARQHYARVANIVIPVMSQITGKFTHVPQAPCDLSDPQELMSWLDDLQNPVTLLPPCNLLTP